MIQTKLVTFKIFIDGCVRICPGVVHRTKNARKDIMRIFCFPAPNENFATLNFA